MGLTQGPPHKTWSIVGAAQSNLLVTLRLRSRHRLLDFGCGSLRAGRLFLTYLDSGNYFGVEPNRWLIEDAIEHQLGEDIIRIKRPTFDHNDRFDADRFGVEFDFIVAQSIFSHAGPDPIRRALRSFKEALGSDGMVAATFVEGRADHTGEDWVYPGVVAYRRRTIAAFAGDAGLAVTRIPWFHPLQTWYLMAADPGRLPPRR